MQRPKTVKEGVSWVHIWLLDSSIILIMLGIWLVSYGETVVIYSYKVAIEGVEHTTFLQAGIYPFLGSLITMLIPVYMMHAKSKFSFGGEEISVLETMVVGLLLSGSFLMMYMTYYAMDSSLQTLNDLGRLHKDKKLADIIYRYRMDANFSNIASNCFLDLLVGVLSVYEIQKHNIVFRKKKKENEDVIPTITVLPDDVLKKE